MKLVVIKSHLKDAIGIVSGASAEFRRFSFAMPPASYAAKFGFVDANRRRSRRDRCAPGVQFHNFCFPSLPGAWAATFGLIDVNRRRFLAARGEYRGPALRRLRARTKNATAFIADAEDAEKTRQVCQMHAT